MGFDAAAARAIEMHSHIDTEDGIALLRRERIDYTLLMWRGEAGMLELAQRHADIVGLLLWVVPTQAGYLEKAEAIARKYPGLVRGFKLHPAMDSYTVTAELLGGLFALANRMNLLIETHTEAGSCNAGRFGPLLAAWPKTKLVLLHGFPADETIAVVNAHKNAYVDTSSTAWGAAYQATLLKAVGKRKIVMGLDSPLGFPYQGTAIQPHFRQAMGEIAAWYGNDAEVAERVLYANARELLDGLGTRVS